MIICWNVGELVQVDGMPQWSLEKAFLQNSDLLRSSQLCECWVFLGLSRCSLYSCQVLTSYFIYCSLPLFIYSSWFQCIYVCILCSRNTDMLMSVDLYLPCLWFLFLTIYKHPLFIFLNCLRLWILVTAASKVAPFYGVSLLCSLSFLNWMLTFPP